MWTRNDSGRLNKMTYHSSFYFVRHGHTPWGQDDILKGPQDLELDDLGQQQAREAGLILKNLLSDSSNAIMISSPLRRAVETAKEIEKATGIPINAQEDRIKERYYGDYRKVGNLSITPPDAETTEEFQKRVSQALNELLLEYNQAKPLIIVSHQKVFEYLAEFLVKRPERLSQGGIGHFMRNENGIWELEILGLKERSEYIAEASSIKKIEHKNEMKTSEKLPTLLMQDLFPGDKVQKKSAENNQHASHKRSYSCGW